MLHLGHGRHKMGYVLWRDHRDLEIATQVKHLVLTGLIDDISVGNAYASEAELAAMAEAFHAPYPSIKVDTEPEITEDELHCSITYTVIVEIVLITFCVQQ